MVVVVVWVVAVAVNCNVLLVVGDHNRLIRTLATAAVVEFDILLILDLISS